MTQSERLDILIVGVAPFTSIGLQQLLAGEGFSTLVEPEKVARFLAWSSSSVSPRLIIIDGNDVDSEFSVCGMLRERFPDSRLVMLADDCAIDLVARAFEAGLDGYLSREAACEALVNAVRLVLIGEKFMPAAAFDALSGLRSNGAGGVWNAGAAGRQLSDREVEILALVAKGEPNKTIGWHLDITESTVKVHIKAILRKLHMRNRTQAAIWAIARGIGTLPDAPARSHVALSEH